MFYCCACVCDGLCGVVVSTFIITITSLHVYLQESQGTQPLAECIFLSPLATHLPFVTREGVLLQGPRTTSGMPDRVCHHWCH